MSAGSRLTCRTRKKVWRPLHEFTPMTPSTGPMYPEMVSTWKVSKDLFRHLAPYESSDTSGGAAWGATLAPSSCAWGSCGRSGRLRPRQVSCPSGSSRRRKPLQRIAAKPTSKGTSSPSPARRWTRVFRPDDMPPLLSAREFKGEFHEASDFGSVCRSRRRVVQCVCGSSGEPAGDVVVERRAHVATAERGVRRGRQ